jgi:hypothetical protein
MDMRFGELQCSSYRLIRHAASTKLEATDAIPGHDRIRANAFDRRSRQQRTRPFAMISFLRTQQSFACRGCPKLLPALSA